jgi:glutamine synthetase
MNPDGSPHETNTRAKLRDILDRGASKHEPWFGFEQEYTLFNGRTPLGWPENGFPAPQGPFYCGVGADEVYGRQLVEEHLQLCIDAGLMIYGVNAEVMPGQWEYQIGYRGIGNESADPLTISDQNWLTRWLLYRVGEEYKVTATLDPKPVKGDWNGAGQHTNFSTKELRDPKTGRDAMELYIKRLEAKHDEHIPAYGDGLAKRLTGDHETCHITSFRAGPSDRGASIRIPLDMQRDGCGYLEDRRPGANADPYVVSARILQTICDL